MTRHLMLDEAEAGAYGDDQNGRFSSYLFIDNREPSTKRTALGLFGACWCELPAGHDWPGKAGGKPHPRGRGR